MAGTYSGALTRQYASANDIRTPYPDKRHALTGESLAVHDDDGSDQYPDSHRVPALQGAEYTGSSIPDDVTQGGGVMLDDPSRSHDGPAVLYPLYTDDQVQAAQKAHEAGPDRGYIRSMYATPPLQGAGEVYAEDIEYGLTIPENVNTAGAPNIMRGINAYPLNNPERVGYVKGVRPGRGPRIFNIHRDRMMHRHRTYDLQPLDDRSAGHHVPVNTPAPGGGAPPMYGPVLPSWMPSWSGRREQVPGYFRAPSQVDADLMVQTPIDNSPVIGGEVL